MSNRYLIDVSCGRENNLTFIRLVLACSVIYGHSYAISRQGGGDIVAQLTGYAFAGGVAVDLFFIISGFLVTASIINRGSLQYLVARALRIYPALILNMIIVVFGIGTLSSSLDFQDYIRSDAVWSYFIGLASTVKGGFFLPGVFEGNQNAAVNGSIWSVLIEVRLYIILAILYMLGLLKSAFRFNIVFFFGVLFFWVNPDLLPEFASGRTGAHVCFLFFVGAFLYINRQTVPVGPFLLLIAFLLCAITLGTPKFEFAYIFLVIALFVNICFGKQFSGFERIGDLSYGVYLYGWPMQQVCVMLVPDMSPLQNTFFSIVLSLGFAYASWNLIEKRLIEKRDLVMAFLISIGGMLQLYLSKVISIRKT